MKVFLKRGIAVGDQIIIEAETDLDRELLPLILSRLKEFKAQGRLLAALLREAHPVIGHRRVPAYEILDPVSHRFAGDINELCRICGKTQSDHSFLG